MAAVPPIPSLSSFSRLSSKHLYHPPSLSTKKPSPSKEQRRSSSKSRSDRKAQTQQKEIVSPREGRREELAEKMHILSQLNARAEENHRKKNDGKRDKQVVIDTGKQVREGMYVSRFVSAMDLVRRRWDDETHAIDAYSVQLQKELDDKNTEDRVVLLSKSEQNETKVVGANNQVMQIIGEQYITTYDMKSGTLAFRMIFWAMVGLILTIAQIYFSFQNDKRKFEETNLVLALKVAISLTTIMTLVELTRYYWYQRGVSHNSWFVADGSAWRDHIIIFYIVEFIILLLHTYPTLGRDLYDNNLGTLTLARLYLLIRVIRDISPIYKNRFIMSRDSTLREGQILEFNWLLVLKFMFDNHTWAFVIALLMIALFSQAYIVWALERVGRDHEFYPLESIYMTVVTMTTVGYGDITPQVGRARIAAGFAALSGLIVLALLSFAVMKSLTESIQDKKVRHILEQRITGGKLKVLAASYIQLVWRHYLEKKEIPFNTPEWTRMMTIFERKNFAIKGQLRKYRRQLQATMDFDDIIISRLYHLLDTQAISWADRFARRLGHTFSRRIPLVPQMYDKARQSEKSLKKMSAVLQSMLDTMGNDVAHYEKHGYPEHVDDVITELDVQGGIADEATIKRHRRIRRNQQNLEGGVSSIFNIDIQSFFTWSAENEQEEEEHQHHQHDDEEKSERNSDNEDSASNHSHSQKPHKSRTKGRSKNSSQPHPSKHTDDDDNQPAKEEKEDTKKKKKKKPKQEEDHEQQE